MAQKKHFICTHTWNNQEARIEALNFMKQMTDKEFFDLLRTEKAETLQHWMGEDDFFFCHWFAESEDAIYEALEAAQFNNLIVTMPNEMPRYVSSEKLTGKVMADPFG